MNIAKLEYSIGDRIKRYRKTKKMTQQELAEVCGVESTVISAFENSKRRPSLDSLAKIASALDVSIDCLYYGDNSERIVTHAADDVEIIVNCFYALWHKNAINLYENKEHGNTLFNLIRPHYQYEICRMINLLNDVKANQDSYSNIDAFTNEIKSSVIKNIRTLNKKYNIK